jgi:UDP-4-amino-4,6-dideoxy-N-acetyl-beta-L-altrosamine N-acetyltransferase
MIKISDYYLKDLESSELDTVLKWRNSEPIRKVMYTNEIISREEHLKWFEQLQGSAKFIVKILYYDTKPIGLVNFSQFDLKNSKCYWGFYIGEEDAPRGSGSILAYLALGYIFETKGIRKLCAEVLDSNNKSLEFHRKIGFVEEGRFVKHVVKNGEYLDVIAMAIFNNEWLEIIKMKLITKLGGKADEFH